VGDALAELESFGSTPLKESVQILTPEPEAAPDSELGRRDGTLPRPPPHRLLVNAKILRRLRGP